MKPDIFNTRVLQGGLGRMGDTLQWLSIIEKLMARGQTPNFGQTLQQGCDHWRKWNTTGRTIHQHWIQVIRSIQVYALVYI